MVEMPAVLGTVLQTLGYYDSGDGGGASYVITNNTRIPKADHTLVNSLTAQLVNEASMDIRQIGAISDGDQYLKTGTNNTVSFDAISLLAEREHGVHYVVNGIFRSVVRINKSNVKITGSGTVFVADNDASNGVSLDIGPVDTGNLAPFGGQPWNYPSGISANAIVYQVASGAVGGKELTTYSAPVGGGSPISNIVNKGDTCILIKGSHTISTPETNHIPEKFQFVKVESASSAGIVVNEELYTEFSGGQPNEAAYVVVWPMLEDIHISGVNFTNSVLNGIYLHRIAGCWNAHIDIETSAETAGGASATNKKLYYGVNVQRGYNGISIARMSEDITVNAVCKIGRVQANGIAQNLSLLIEENPKSIFINNFMAENGSLRVYGTSEHTKITGNVEIKNTVGAPCLDFSTLETNSYVDLNVNLESNSTVGTAISTFLAACDLNVRGVIRNSSSGLAWDHTNATSSVRPKIWGLSSNADFSSTHYINCIRTDINRKAILNSSTGTISGVASFTISGDTATKIFGSGRLLTSSRRIGVGDWLVNIGETLAANGVGYAVLVASDAFSQISVARMDTSSFRIFFRDSDGVLVDPGFFTVTIIE